jgi:hypothetical protein
MCVCVCVCVCVFVCEGVGWIELVQDIIQRQNFMTTEIYVRVP